MAKELLADERDELMDALKTRFEQHKKRRAGVSGRSTGLNQTNDR